LLSYQSAALRPESAMDESVVEAIARQAGLQRALEAFPDDVAAAAAAAAKATERVRRSSGMLSEASEPWPPMVVRK
jgi:hypothetical protein